MKYKAKIEWFREIPTNKEIRYSPQISIKNNINSWHPYIEKRKDITVWSINVENEILLNSKETISIMYFKQPLAPISEIFINDVFELYEGNKMVALGVILETFY